MASAIYKVNVRFNLFSLGSAVNVFYCRQSTGTLSGDSTVLAALEDWITAILTPAATITKSTVTLAGAQVLQVNAAGVTQRIVGNITPTWSPAGTGDSLALPTAGSLFARTNTPKVRGAKRVPAFTEGYQSDGLFNNTVVTVLAGYALAWLLGPAGFGLPESVAGVVSSAVVDFVPFNGTGAATNIPGTQTTRKPLRGS